MKIDAGVLHAVVAVVTHGGRPCKGAHSLSDLARGEEMTS